MTTRQFREIASFSQVKTPSGHAYLVGKLSGVDVAVAPTGEHDEDGNEIWRMIADRPTVTAPTHDTELLEGGCALVTLKPRDIIAEPLRRRKRRAASEKR